ncbi:MAG: Crp/Fnr family transcriptional regulator [Bacteroidota bacterium]|nr:Crp/Fnr family transcriptional regulator [Bacteroidota bacterium]
MLEILADCPLFNGMENETLKRLFDSTLYQVKRYDKDQMIAQSEEPCNHLLIILQGNVRGEMVDFSGKTIKIEDIEAPSSVASAFIFGERKRFPVNIVANTPVNILYIPKASLIGMFQDSELFLENFLNMVSSRAQFLSMKIKFLSFKTIKGKIAHFILSHGGSEKDVIQLKRSQEAIASLFGVTRPALARAMGEMAAEGLIEVHRKEIRILDRGKLSELVR